MNKFCSFERPFQVWLFSVSHKILLLRSVRSDAFETRIDVLFGATQFIRLSTDLDSLLIEETSIDAVNSDFEPKRLIEQSKIFRINGSLNHVIASSVTFHEDNGLYYERSALLPEGSYLHS